MPLAKHETEIDETYEDDRVGFWMTVAETDPVEPIRIFVPYSTLEQLDPSQPRDLQAAAKIFAANRERIENAAGTKYDKEGVSDEKYQGRPILIVSSDDLP